MADTLTVSSSVFVLGIFVSVLLLVAHHLFALAIPVVCMSCIALLLYLYSLSSAGSLVLYFWDSATGLFRIRNWQWVDGVLRFNLHNRINLDEDLSSLSFEQKAERFTVLVQAVSQVLASMTPEERHKRNLALVKELRLYEDNPRSGAGQVFEWEDWAHRRPSGY